MVETGHDRARCAASAAILEPVKLSVVVWLCEGGEHEIVGILQEGMGGIRDGVDILLVSGIKDTELDDGWGVDGTAVSC